MDLDVDPQSLRRSTIVAKTAQIRERTRQQREKITKLQANISRKLTQRAQNCPCVSKRGLPWWSKEKSPYCYISKLAKAKPRGCNAYSKIINQSSKRFGKRWYRTCIPSSDSN